MFKTRFESVGLYTPEKILSTRDLLSQMETKPLFDLEELTGIKNRRVRSESEDSYTLAIAAAEDCLKNSRYEASELDVIIYAAITRYKGTLKFYAEPAMSLFIKNKLGARSSMNFEITSACASMFAGAYVLDNMIKAGVVQNGMVVSGECITPNSETAVKEIKDPIDDQFASLTLGDAGAAFILDKSQDDKEGIDFIEFVTVAEFSDLCFGMPSELRPASAMYTKAVEIHQEVIKRFPLLQEEILKKYGMKPSDYDFIIPHQTSIRAIKSGLKAHREYGNYSKEEMPEALFSLQEYGNTASTAHFVVLYNSLKEKIIKEGSRVGFHAFASGITFGFISATIGALKVDHGNID
ncbi:MAG: 3-oxoacyl-ACP synthase [Deltaproteobacteria bacterium]|nr:3-oxoacyl-ACP synthase [Deltaproteobacteria bacterium]